MKNLKELLLVTLSLFLLTASIRSQEKLSLSFTDIMKFRSISAAAISDDGNWVVYAAVPDRGDPEVKVHSTDGKIEHSIPTADKPSISSDSKWVAAVKVEPAEELEKKKKDEKKGPGSGMALLNLASGEQKTVERIKSFSFSNSSEWLLYHSGEDEADDKNGKGDKKNRTFGTDLQIMSLSSGKIYEYPFVVSYSMDSISGHLALFVKDSTGESNGLYISDLTDSPGELFPVYADSNIWADCISWNNKQGTLAFLAGSYGEKEKKVEAQLYTWIPGDKTAVQVLADSDLSEGWKVYHTNKLQWSKDGKRLFLGIKPSREISVKDEEKLDTVIDLFDTEKILTKREVDVWHWDDPYINSNQKKRWKNEKDRTYTGVYYPEDQRFVALADSLMPGIQVAETERYLVGYSDLPYSKKVTWDGRYNDYYLVDAVTGDKRLILREQQHTMQLSPDGTFLVYYREGDWYLMNTRKSEAVNLTADLNVSFGNEDWDYPASVPGYGTAGWIGGSEAVMIYDKYDIWLFYTSGGEPVCVTEGAGRGSEIIFRVRNLDREKDFLDKGEDLLLSAYHDEKKHTGVYGMKAGISGVKRLVEEPMKYTVRARAKDADKVLFSRESYGEFPDLWVTGMQFRKPAKITNLNPQVSNFAWGEPELIDWLSLDGRRIQGVLIKPGNYEEGKQYPVLVYYYRFFTDQMYEFPNMAINHRPCYPFYTSNDYAIFLPDIRFDIGSPGYSATKCLVPGVQKLIELGVADPDAIALHGHSWSGYQTAFVITQTDMFACAIAGAPVSNMTSAYGGIRWGTGLARQFQYEKSQSRIGGSLWEMRDKYIENSPLFYADRINTPLLIAFGDEDEAVPWYQGIELYLAMRRLEKECVFLQYRGEPHHLKKYANKLDYSIKFKEYMDHYLKGTPAPEWISSGVPYTGD
ncbi:MAG: prolyl oligopeptidase family serine peptidase [Bacteroidales bacterium]